MTKFIVIIMMSVVILIFQDTSLNAVSVIQMNSLYSCMLIYFFLRIPNLSPKHIIFIPMHYLQYLDGKIGKAFASSDLVYLVFYKLLSYSFIHSTYALFLTNIFKRLLLMMFQFYTTFLFHWGV